MKALKGMKAMKAGGVVMKSAKDTHVTICPYFEVPADKVNEFKAAFPDFYSRTKNGTNKCIYYGFAQCGK